MEQPVGGRQPEKFAQPAGLVGQTGVKAARKTGIQAKATEQVRDSVNSLFTQK